MAKSPVAQNRPTITADRLRDVLDYDQETGVFRWRHKHGNVKAGDVAGCTRKDDYVIMWVDGRFYLGHRLAWLYIHGRWPAVHIDHKNGKSNRIENLREATRSQNLANRKRDKDNKCGFKGVYRIPSGKYVARIGCQGAFYHIGVYASPELAHQAYLDAATRLFGEFARGG